MLDETRVAENTLVMFLSDNGMAFPFAKTNCYLNSTRTPWMVETGDPALEAFRGRASRQALDDLMDHLADAIGKHVDE